MGQPYTWIIREPVSVYMFLWVFYFFVVVRFKLSAALSLIIRSVADASGLLYVTEGVLLLALHLVKVKF